MYTGGGGMYSNGRWGYCLPDDYTFIMSLPRTRGPINFVPDVTARILSQQARIPIIEKPIFDGGRKVYTFSLPVAQMVGPANPMVRHAIANQPYSRNGSKKELGEHRDPVQQ